MEFCSKCGAILSPKKIKSGDQPMLVFVCNKCGQKIKDTNEDVKIRGKTIEHSPKQLVSVIDKENQLSTLPTIRITCIKCGNKSAYAWQVQTRGADESSTQFLRCTNCGYTFRECT
jgi:DNA-directed RNA polymerase subunit M